MIPSTRVLSLFKAINHFVTALSCEACDPEQCSAFNLLLQDELGASLYVRGN